MAEGTLVARSALDGYTQDFDGVQLAERTGVAIVSIAVPADGREAFAAKVRAAWGIEVPPVGRSALSISGIRLLGLQPDLFFVMFAHQGDRPETAVAAVVGLDVYLTDQSDGWVMLELVGARCIAAFERLCPLDLHCDAFPVHAVARTVMEHLAVIMLREDENAFLLLSPMSSARSFLHTVKTACQQRA